MPLDDLVQVIETIQNRIRDHGDSLRQNETRTRMALIDPLLTALGWDVADPGLITAEYNVGNGRADYALLVPSNKPTALIEAKHLGEQLESPNHQEQVFTYALMQQVKYAGLTDGNRWVLDDVSDFSGERRKLDITIANMPAYQCALKFLLLWRPNLGPGQPIPASVPVFSESINPTTTVETQTYSEEPSIPPPVSTSNEEWISLVRVKYRPGSLPPSAICFSDGSEKQIQSWVSVIDEVADHLARKGKLIADKCPVRSLGVKYIVHSQPIHADGTPMQHISRLSNGLFLEKRFHANARLRYSRFLLEHFGEDVASVWLKFN